MESILLDVRFQYALHTTSFEEPPFSGRTFSRFRERVLSYERETGVDLLKEEIYALSDVCAVFNEYCDIIVIKNSSFTI